MNEPTARFWDVFFEVYENLPRQGPGNRASAERALMLCSELPEHPAVLDLGCGVGGQTLHLADMTTGNIIAIDSHAPGIEKLKNVIKEQDLTHRVKAQVGDMEKTGFPPESFDLIWSEGALYNIGIDKALEICSSLLKKGGYLAFTDAVWRKENPPPEVRNGFDLDYPSMGWTLDIISKIENRPCMELIGHFTLPDEAWWEDFYTPMEKRVQQLREKYKSDNEAIEALDQINGEIEIHRTHSDYYAYEFFILRKIC